ncbi:uncharacterized protein LOC101855051 isoform X1 [Aplysia californica]|uniref:Uncharacterized protein LOC101855051 isoform X1 n=1 Tax=Aplysia californica TaxID=6500 RepID=A0ABM0K3Q8_APLCA|nr:uncharacterized protein LOC101855051 isoform X1 [Aplysia californica]XP_005108057.1 uncharacterized protein LOC101855051 isoform X1 [Aplysia californica]
MSKEESRPSDAKKVCKDFPKFINFSQLCRYTATTEECVQFGQKWGLFPKSCLCPSCGDILDKVHFSRRGNSTQARFRCSKRACRKYISITKNTWFEGAKVSFRKSLFLAYCFVNRSSYDTAIRETSGPRFDDCETSTKTVADLYSYCREVIFESLYCSDEVRQIGGANFCVEVDEAKFGKRKFNRGRVANGQWVFGGICRETKECFLVPVQDRTQETLVNLIKKHVAPGTIIRSDCFKSNECLEREGFRHLTIKHSENFGDRHTSAYTNIVESTWWAVKKSLCSTHAHTQKQHFAAYLAEYIWHQQNVDTKCKFIQFLKEICKVYPGLDA